MAAPNTQSLIANAECYNCIPPGMEGSVVISLLAQIAGVSLNTNSLIANALCYQCIPKGMEGFVIISLLAQIVANGSTGGGNVPAGAGFVFAGNYGGNPPPFTPTTAGAIAIDTYNNTFRQWQWANGAWD